MIGGKGTRPSAGRRRRLPIMALVPLPLSLAYLADPNSVHTRRWVEFFAARGHFVHLLIGTEDVVRPGLSGQVNLHRYPRFGRRRLPFVSSMQGRRALRTALRRIRPDVLHGHYLTRYGWQARLSGFHPLVISPWGSDLFVTPHESTRARVWARLTLRGADLVTVVSEQMRDAVLARGVRRDRIEFVHFGVDTVRLHPADPDATRLAHLGLDDRPIVFSPRAVRPIYRQDVVVDAFARLETEATLVLTARNADPETLSQVRARIASAGIGDVVRVIDDIDEEDMLALYQQSVVVVSVPESDGIPISVLEAMACARPVVASDLPGPRELLAAADPDLLVPVGDAAATATALRRVLEGSAADREVLGASLRASVVATADRKANMERMEELYLALRAGGR